MLDHEHILYTLLARAAPDLEFIPALDIGTVNRMPVVYYGIEVQNAVDGSPSPPTAWDAALTLTVFAETRDEAVAHCRLLYDTVWSWDQAWSGENVVAGVGAVGNIEDQSVFGRTATIDLDSLTMHQWDGSFALQLYRA